MHTKLLTLNTEKKPPPREGDLFKIIDLYGTIFEIRYGYYEERDRCNKRAEPMEIYPNFIKEPKYTEDGSPFATAMQESCEHFKGKRNEDSTCDDCAFYQHCDELLGICLCPKKKKETKEEPRTERLQS